METTDTTDTDASTLSGFKGESMPAHLLSLAASATRVYCSLYGPLAARVSLMSRFISSIILQMSSREPTCGLPGSDRNRGFPIACFSTAPGVSIPMGRQRVDPGEVPQQAEDQWTAL